MWWPKTVAPGPDIGGGRRELIPGRKIFGVSKKKKSSDDIRWNFFKLMSSDGLILLFFPGVKILRSGSWWP